MFILMLWICLAPQVFGASQVSDLPYGSSLEHSVQAEEFATPASAELSKDVTKVMTKANHSTSTPSTRITEEVPVHHICGKPNQNVHISHEHSINSMTSLCAESGAVVNKTFSFLQETFQFSDCRNKNLLQHRAEHLYCSIHHKHQRCLNHESSSITKSNEVDRSESGKKHTSFPVARDLSLTLTQLKSAIDFLCRVRKDFNKACVLEQLGRVEACIGQDTLTILRRQKDIGTNEKLDLCKHLEVTAICTYEILEEACTKNEARIMTSLMAHYLKEPQCSLSSANTERWNYSYVLVLLVTGLMRHYI